MTVRVDLSTEDVEQAHVRLRGHIRYTPLLESDELNALAGRRVLVKAECLQHSGSFKFRGAMNRLLRLVPAERARGVVAFSSGNHGRALAMAARRLGLRATIIMPRDAPRAKIAGARREGAKVMLYDRRTEDREAIARRLIAGSGATLVPPYDDPDVIAGQGTVAREVLAALVQLDDVPTHFIVPCSGGGLAAGCALAVRSKPGIAMMVAEPKGFDDAGRSLLTGEPVTNASTADSICDALLVPTPGKLTFPILQSVSAQGVAVSDSDVLAAIRAAAACLKIVLEPGGAAGLAAVLAGKLPASVSPVVVVASGGNVDPAMLAHALSGKSMKVDIEEKKTGQ